MGKKVISIHKLKIGMFVEELDRPWLDTPFLFHRKKLKKQIDIDKLIENGIKQVTINTDKGLDVEEETVLEQSERAHLIDTERSKNILSSELTEADPIEIVDELSRAHEIRTNMSKLVKDMFHDVRMGKSLELKEVRAQVAETVDSVFRNRDALLCLVNLKDYDNYTFIHSVNVCILAVSFGRHLSLTRDKIENLGLGALLHDIGKTQIPESILNKPGRFTREEYDIMKRHVNFGVEILSKYGNIPEEAMLVAYEHHERYNGSGYPRKLYGDKISLMGQIGGISDVYDATTYDRVYQKGASCHSVVKSLYEWGDKLFNRTMVERFIRCIGIYPFGSFVELNTGHCGIVVSVNHQMLLRPKILVVLDEKKRPQKPELMDMAEIKDGTGNYIFQIEKEVSPSFYSIDVGKILKDTGYYQFSPPPLT